MVGGHPRATDAVTPLLKQMGKTVIYCGKHGAGGGQDKIARRWCSVHAQQLAFLLAVLRSGWSAIVSYA